MNQRHSLLNVVKIFIAVTGFIIALWGFLMVLLIAVGMILSPADATLDSATIGVAFFALGVGLGGALAWHAGRAYLQRPSARFGLPPVWILILILIPTLIIGQLLISFDLLPMLTFPPFHIVAAILPSLGLLALAERTLKLPDIRWREIVIQLSGGAFLSTTVAFLMEIIVGIAILLIVFLITALFPGGLAVLEEMAANLQNPIWLENPDNLADLLLSPPIAITIILVFVIFAPLLEEMAKLIGVILMSYHRPSLGRAFLWGVASGAGFGLVENLFNTVTGLDVWALVILMRVGATLMHCLNSGLMAIGWHYAFFERRLSRLLGLYGLSVIIHAAWNGAVIGIAGTALVATGSTVESIETIGGWIVILFVALLCLLFVAMLAAFILLTRRLREGAIPSNQIYSPDQPPDLVGAEM